MRQLGIAALGICLIAVAGCQEESTAVTEIEAEGAVSGVVWLDRNGNDVLDAADAAIRDVVVQFFAGMGGEPAFTARSGVSGEFSVGGMPVGDYQVRVDSATAGDSVRVLRVDSAQMTITRDDTAAVAVGFTYPTLAVDTARRQPADTRLFVEGIALNGWDTFADSTVHVRDRTGAMRTIRIPPVAVSAGDSVRVQGTVTLRSGQPVLRNGSLFVIQPGAESPSLDTVTAATAAAADGALLDADLIHMDSVVIRDTTTNALGELIFTVGDASGTVDVLFDRDIAFQLFFPTDVIGNILDVTGLLVPSGTPGEWLVKPRANTDVTVGPLSYPSLTVAEARTRPAGTRIQVEGMALNAWNAFGDSIVHVRDTTGAIRGLRVSAADVAAGDSVKLLGTVSTVNAQPVLRDVRPNVLVKGLSSPTPEPVTAGEALQARGGTLDAGLVRLDSVVIQDTTRNAAGERVIVVEDGTGNVRIVLDQDVAFLLSFSVEVVGTILDVTGLLVSAETAGEWIVKPRTNSDITVGPLSYPTLPVDSARSQPSETRVIVEGLALNEWDVFGDATLHVADSTAAIRALRVPPAAIASGDSIRVIGTITTAFGQPVFRDARVVRLRTGVVSPPADSLGTGTAGTADLGALDAALARIAGAVVQSTGETPDNDFILTVDDGSGTVDVVLDREITFFFDPTTIVGRTVSATGVLVPSTTSTGVWVLKPRENQDLVVN